MAPRLCKPWSFSQNHKRSCQVTSVQVLSVLFQGECVTFRVKNPERWDIRLLPIEHLIRCFLLGEGRGRALVPCISSWYTRNQFSAYVDIGIGALITMKIEVFWHISEKKAIECRLLAAPALSVNISKSLGAFQHRAAEIPPGFADEWSTQLGTQWCYDKHALCADAPIPHMFSSLTVP